MSATHHVVMSLSSDAVSRFLGSAVVRQRALLGMNQEQFARHVGIDRGYLGGIERGRYDLTLRLMLKILRSSEASPQVFFREIDAACQKKHVSRRVDPPDGVIRVAASASDAACAGALVRAARARAGITQEELAFKAGLARSEMSNIERGRCQPRLGTLLRVFDEVGLHLAEFFGGLLGLGRTNSPHCPHRSEAPSVGALMMSDKRHGKTARGKQQATKP